MNDSDIRRRRLKELVDRMGPTVAARYLGKPVRQINDMIAERKAFGGKVARAMELHAGLDRFYFDTLEPDLSPTGQPKPEKIEKPLGRDELKRKLDFFYEGMSKAHKEVIVNVAKMLFTADNPKGKKTDPWDGMDRRKAQVLSLGELIEVIEERDADNHPHHRVSKQGTNKTSGRVVGTRKRG